MQNFLSFLFRYFSVRICCFALCSLTFCMTSTLYAEGMFRVVKNEAVNAEEPTKLALPPQLSGNETGFPEPRKKTAGEGNIPVRSNLFYAGIMQGIIVWNGKTDEQGEEILIVSQTEIAVDEKDDVVLGIIPLPGKPISVTQSNCNITAVKDEFTKKLRAKIPPSGTASPSVITPPQAPASRAVFVLEFTALDNFESDVNRYLRTFYDSHAEVQIFSNDLNIVKKYFEKGFRYFAFDLTSLGDSPTISKPLLFHFKSPSVYYPLAINAVGGSGHSLVDLIVMTPTIISPRIVAEKEQKETLIIVKGKTSVEFSTEELQRLDPKLAAFCKKDGLNTIFAQNILFEAEELENLDGDFAASPQGEK